MSMLAALLDGRQPWADLILRLPLHHLLPWLLILRMRMMMMVITMMLQMMIMDMLALPIRCLLDTLDRKSVV